MKQRIQSASSVFSRVTLRVVVSIVGVLILLLLPARSKLVAITPVTSDQQLVKQCTGQSYKPHVKQGSLVYNDCGWTQCMRYPGPVAMEPADIERVTIGPLAGTRVSVYQFSVLGRSGVQVSTSLLPRARLDPKQIHSMSVWKVRKTFAHLDGLKTDPLKIIAAACRKYGITCQVSIQMSGKSKIYKQSPWFVFHPGGLLENSYLNYADTASIGFRKAQVREILEQYDVDGIDMDFTGFQLTFATGQYQTAVSNLMGLVRDLREMTRSAGKTLSARFDYSPARCINNGLEVDKMLAEGLFDQISLGAMGDQTPDASIDWWIARAHRIGCKVFPAIETLPHPVPDPIFGGIGIHPSNDMVKHGYGRPSAAYMRAVAANAYASGADGVTLFNIACTDGPFPKTALTELADPEAIALADKQYVASVWGFRPWIYFDFWTSSFGMMPNQNLATHTIQIADDFATAARAGQSPRALLTLDFQGINTVNDIEVLVNGTPVKWNSYEYNHYDHGFWDDILEFDVPISALRNGSNVIQLKRRRTNKLFEGTLEVRKCVLEILYPGSKPDPSEIEIRHRLGSDDWFAPGLISPATTNDESVTQSGQQPLKMPGNIVYNDDGWSSYMRYPAPQTPGDIVETILGPVIGTGVTVYQFCSLGGHAVNYNSLFLPRVGEMMDKVNSMHVWRMRKTLRYIEEKYGTDPLHLVAKACREHGIACQFSLRMNDAHHTYKRGNGWYFPELQSPWFEQHKDAMLPNNTLDYAHPDVHVYRKKQIQEILDNYDVTGIDLDFTRFAPWFRTGLEKEGMPKMIQLVRELRAMTKKAGKTLSARFEYDPQQCISTGLDLETMLSEQLFDQITLGVTGSHVPDASIDWWVEHMSGTGCKLYPGIEGQLHWIPAPGGGGMGTLPANDGVRDDYGPPTMAYMRAVVSVHHMAGADGTSLFNFTCADGPFDRAIFTELADPEAMKFKDKQYVARVWYRRFSLEPLQKTTEYTLRLADDFKAANQLDTMPQTVLILGFRGIAQLDDVEVTINGGPALERNGYHYNQSDHDSFTDILAYNVPISCLHCGDNVIRLQRAREYAGYMGEIQVRKCILEIDYPPLAIENRPRTILKN